MQGVLEPLALPIATDVIPGEQADDGLYTPIIDRMLTILTQPGPVFVGDCIEDETVLVQSAQAILRDRYVEWLIAHGFHRLKGVLVSQSLEQPLQAFSKITLSIMPLPDRLVRHVAPLTPLQVRILELLGLSPDICRSLAGNSA